MCVSRKQIVTLCAALVLSASGVTAVQAGDSAGGIALGQASGGIADYVFVSAPADFSYVLETKAGSFLDCGDEQFHGSMDQDGRGMPALDCGVTLTETLVIPAAATSAQVIIHF